MGDFKMPSLGADMDVGTVVEWLVKPGDEVRRGDVVAVVETEKSTIEVEIFESGVIEEILVQPGQQVPVGTVLARVGAAVAATAGAPPAVPAPAAPPSPRRDRAPRRSVTAATEGRVRSPVVRHLAEGLGVDITSLHGSGRGGTLTRADVEEAATAVRKPAGRRVRASPLARRLALELGVDLSQLAPTGPGGSISERDVRLAASTPPPPALAPVPVPVAETSAGRATVEERQVAMRKAIGALMARSKREIPHYYLSTTVDMSSAVSWLERANLERPVTERIVVPVLLLKATALAVAKVPEMNGFWVDDAFVPVDSVHLGVAVSLRGGGVIAPAIHDVETLSLVELMRQLKDLVERARKGVLRSSEMSDPTITVTNLGDLGVETVFGVIYAPQVALVGFGRVSERPWALEGMLGARHCVTATLSADHRASDGHRGGLFLAEIDRLLQRPERL